MAWRQQQYLHSGSTRRPQARFAGVARRCTCIERAYCWMVHLYWSCVDVEGLLGDILFAHNVRISRCSIFAIHSMTKVPRYGFDRMNIRIKIAGFLIGTTYIAVVAMIIFKCWPLHKQWQVRPDPGSKRPTLHVLVRGKALICTLQIIAILVHRR